MSMSAVKFIKFTPSLLRNSATRSMVLTYSIIGSLASIRIDLYKLYHLSVEKCFEICLEICLKCSQHGGWSLVESGWTELLDKWTKIPVERSKRPVVSIPRQAAVIIQQIRTRNTRNRISHACNNIISQWHAKVEHDWFQFSNAPLDEIKH